MRSPHWQDAANAKYVSLTTFRRTGVPVATAVWIAPAVSGDRDELAVITVDNTGKTKRLAHTARVELRPCDQRGRVPEGAPTWTGRARVVRDPAQVLQVKAAIGAKYGWWYRAFTAVEAAMIAVRPRKNPRAGILITLD